MSLLLLKVKMRRMDKPVSEIGRHFQTFSVADEGLVEMTCFAAGLSYEGHPITSDNDPIKQNQFL